MKYYFTALYKSLYDSAWLKAARFSSSKAWSYFCLFIFVVSAVIITPVVLEVRSLAGEFGQNFSSAAPDFQANFKGGKLTIEKLPQPFVYRSPDFALVIDTVATDTVAMEQFVTTTYADTVLITSSGVEIHDAGTGEGRTQSWSSLPDYTISKSDVESAVLHLNQPGYLALAVFAIFIGLYIGFFVTKLYNIVLVTLLVSITARLFGRAVKFRELFTIGLYAITLPSIISLILGLFGAEIPYVQFMALLAFLLAIVFTREAGGVESPKPKVE